jgi:hypothetical protein
MSSLTPLASDLWIAARPLPLIVGDIGTHMTVVRLPDGGLFLHSPAPFDAEMQRRLDDLGPVRCVVAPNKVHHFFVGAYAAAYPDARLFAAPGLAEKRRDLQFDAVLGDDPPPEWRGVIEQHLFRGAPYINEVVFFHPASRTLMLTDLAFNMRRSPPGRARVFCSLVGATGRFGPHRMLRLMMRDRASARASVQRILAWDFDRVTVTHGEVLATGGRQQFAAAFEFLGA